MFAIHLSVFNIMNLFAFPCEKLPKQSIFLNYMVLNPNFSRVETPDRQSVSRLSYTLVCETRHTAGYTDVSACPKGEEFFLKKYH